MWIRAVIKQQGNQRRESIFRSEIQWRAAAGVDDVRVGAMREEQPRHCFCGGRVPVRGQCEDGVQRRVAREVSDVYAPGGEVTMVQQHAEVPGLLPGCGPVQRSAVVDIGVGDVGAELHQQGDHLLAPVGGGLVQESGIGGSPDAGAGAVGEKQIDGGEVAGLHGAVQRRLTVVVVGAAAHVDGEAGGEGGSDEALVAVEGGPEERVHVVFVEEGEGAEARLEQLREAPVGAQEGIDVARAGEIGTDEQQQLVGAGEELHCGRAGGYVGMRGRISHDRCGGWGYMWSPATPPI